MLALVIGKYGTLRVEIFEACPNLSTIGAGITIFGRSTDVMKDLGLYDELVQMAIEPPKEDTGLSASCSLMKQPRATYDAVYI